MKEMTSKSFVMPQVITKKGKSPLKNFSLHNTALLSIPTLALTPLGEHSSFTAKKLDLFEPVSIGRSIGPKSAASPDNGFFESKVLSRQHAEIKGENGKVYIKDCGSSNGTFLNGKRLSPEGEASEYVEIKSGDLIDFGIDIIDEDGVTVSFYKISAKASVTVPGDQAESVQGKENVASDKSLREREQPSVQVMEEAIVELAATIGKIEAEAEELPKVQQQLRAQLDEATAQNELLKRKVLELESDSSGKQLETLRDKVKGAESLLAKVEAQNQALEAKIKSLQSSETASQKESERLRADLKQLEDLRKSLKEAKTENESLANKVKELKDAANLAQAQQKVLSEQLDAQKSESIKSLKASLAEATLKLADIHAGELSTLKDTHEEQLYQLQRENAELKSALRSKPISVISSLVCGVCLGLGIAFGMYSYH